MPKLNAIGSHKTKVICDNGKTEVIYHQTAVVTITANKIILNTGGWKTNTTKVRMNQASRVFNLGYTVYQKDFEWYVMRGGRTINFYNDTLTLER